MGVKHLQGSILCLLYVVNGNIEKKENRETLFHTLTFCFVCLVLFPEMLEYIRSSSESREADHILLLSLMHLLKMFDV